MSSFSKLTFVTIILILINNSHIYAKTSLTKSGDILQLAIPLVSFGVATYKKDDEGQNQFFKSLIINTLIAHSAKYLFNYTPLGKRPRGGQHSFPSGHTSFAFQGAFFLQQRYGSLYGVPAIGLASLTAYSRVKGKYHHTRDVIAAVTLSYAVNYFFVTKFQPKSFNISIDRKSNNLSFKQSL